MKYVIVIPDGAADLPHPSLAEQTPLRHAKTPALDALARRGRVGCVHTTPPGKPCGSDVCSMSLLGYNPLKYHTGRAPLEAAALGLELGPDDWVFRVNLVQVRDGLMEDHSAGAIGSAEAARLFESLTPLLPFDQMELIPGVSYRGLLVDRGGRDWSELESTPPHDIPGLPIRKNLPVGGDHAKALSAFITQSAEVLAMHEVNLTRQEMGEAEATHAWPWGQGDQPTVPSFASRFGLRGAMITAVDLLAGIANLIGWDRLDVPGQTSYHDTDYDAAATHAAQALEAYDLVCVHIEAPDEASHAGDTATKVEAIQAIDERVVAPLVQTLEDSGEPWRMMVLPDHYTRLDTRKHDPTPVPVLIAGHKVVSAVTRLFDETQALQSDLQITHGHELMEYFLFAGLRN